MALFSVSALAVHRIPEDVESGWPVQLLAPGDAVVEICVTSIDAQNSRLELNGNMARIYGCPAEPSPVHASLDARTGRGTLQII